MERFAFLIAALGILSAPFPVVAYHYLDRATDDSVCDLSPLTTYWLSQRPSVPAGTQKTEEIYARLALRKITPNCKNGQTLILHSRDGDAVDDRYFRAVANQVCTVSELTRVPTPTSRDPMSFQVKCPISKIKEASEWLSKAEADKSTETMISEGAPKRTADQSAAGSAKAARCDKLTLSSILGGGGGCQ